MAEGTYSEEREGQLSTSSTTSQFRVPQGPRSTMLRNRYRTAGSVSETDYLVFKATIRSAVEELKGEMRSQHEHTRAEVRSARAEILAAVKSSPAEFIELVCEFGFVLLLFSLAVRFTLNLELVNTAFAVFMLFALALYWSMARLKRRAQMRGN